MKFKPIPGIINVGIFIIYAFFNQAQAAGYTITDLGTLGGDSSDGTDINDQGHVTGYSDTASGERHGFYYDGSTMHSIGALYQADPNSRGTAINDNGHITGLSYAQDSPYNDYHAFLYDGSVMQDLGTLGGTNSQGQDINNNDQVVGFSRTPISNLSVDPFRAFLYDNGVMEDIGTLGGTYSYAYGINNDGHVTGWANTQNDNAMHAFIYNGTQMRDIGTLGGSSSIGNRINDQGQVTGWSNPANSDAQHAFFYDGTTMQDLGTLGGEDSRGLDINNAGQIVGASYLATDFWAAFLYDGAALLNLCEITACVERGWTSLDWARGINDTGDITGSGTINGQSRAFVISWNDQPMPEICTDTIDNDEDGLTDCEDVSDCSQHAMCYRPPGMAYDLIDLGTLGGNHSEGGHVNNLGMVTGSSTIAGDSETHAFLYDGSGMIDLGTLGYPDSYGYSINDNGDIVGNLYIEDNIVYDTLYHVFLDQGSGMLDLHGSLGGPCGTYSSHAYDINDSGHIVGYCTVALQDWLCGNVEHAFVYDGSTTLDLYQLSGVVGVSNSVAYGVNNSGQVTGEIESSGGLCGGYKYAFLYDGNDMHDLGTLGGNESGGNAINDSGHVAGWSHKADGAMRAFYYDGSTLQDLGTLAGAESAGQGINNNDQVVGYSRLANGEKAAFLYDGNRMLYLCLLTDCQANGWSELRSATDINDRGDITGYGVINGETHAFLAIAQNDPVAITGVWPATANVGEAASVFIFGDNFTTDGSTEVYFNGVRQWLVAPVSNDMLIVRLAPVTADLFGPVTVTTPSGSATSATEFGTLLTGLNLTGVWPGDPKIGEYSSIFLFGSEFTTDGSTEVYFNGVRQWLVAPVSSDMLIVRVLGDAALSGTVTVVTLAGSVDSSAPLIFVP